MTPRESTVLNAIKLVTHTNEMDPEFFAHCIELQKQDKSTGFGSRLEQNDAEFQQLLPHLKGCRSLLEIGSRYGESALAMARCLEPNGRVVCVDLPDESCIPPKKDLLYESLNQIANLGHEVWLVAADSKKDSSID